jgi:hypothetical protein
MRKVKVLFIPALCTVAFSAALPFGAIADGLMMNGHVAGPHTTLVLTKEQQKQLRARKNDIVLTPYQKQVMRARTGVTGVTSVYVLPNTYRGCTCESKDVAARITVDKIEIADYLYGRDFDRFIYNYEYWSKINSAKSTEDALTQPSEVVRLRKEASSLLPKNVKRSSELIKKAISIEPNYTLARQLLALNYTHEDRDDKPLMQKKAAYEEAVGLVRGYDAILEEHLNYQLHLINEMIDARKKLPNGKLST